MLHLLHALGAGEARHLDAAAGREQWLLRPWHKRRAAKRLQAMAAQTRSLDEAHIARLAYLAANQRPVEAAACDDEIEVARRFAELTPPAPPRAPWQTLSLAATLLLLGAAGGVHHQLTQAFDPREDGVGKLLANGTTDYVLAVSRGVRVEPERAKLTYFSQPAPPTWLLAELDVLLAGHAQALREPGPPKPLLRALPALNRALAAHGEPYVLDITTEIRPTLFYAYYIQRSLRVTGPDGALAPVHEVWRLDHLNLEKPALGYTHPDAENALVLLDTLEGFLLGDILPALAEGEAVELLDDDTLAKPKDWHRFIERTTGQMVRQSLGGGPDGERTQRLGALLAERRTLVRSWADALAAQNAVLHVPTRLVPEADYMRELRHRVDRDSRYRWDALHQELTRPEMLATFERLRDRMAEQIARHEVEHRLDFARHGGCTVDAECTEFAVPARLRELLAFRAEASALTELPAHVVAETAAYLAEMAHPHALPKLSLVSLLREALNRRHRSTVYTLTAVAVLDALAGALDIRVPALPLSVGGRPQPAHVASFASTLYLRDDQQLREAAHAAYRELFQRELTPIDITLERTHTSWRH